MQPFDQDASRHKFIVVLPDGTQGVVPTHDIVKHPIRRELYARLPWGGEVVGVYHDVFLPQSEGNPVLIHVSANHDLDRSSVEAALEQTLERNRNAEGRTSGVPSVCVRT